MDQLYSYWRSSCSRRVRIALYWFKHPFEYCAVNLLENEQQSSEYLQLNPLGLVPTLKTAEGILLCQSMAILEYLNEIHGGDLLPSDALGRAKVRQVCMGIVADCQPLQNISVIRAIPDPEWPAKVIRRALNSIQVGENSAFCFGDRVTLADLCLIPQLYNARRFGIEVEREYPRLAEIEARCNELEPFKLAHPSRQPDAK